jgi:hypothetical protein
VTAKLLYVTFVGSGAFRQSEGSDADKDDIIDIKCFSNHTLRDLILSVSKNDTLKDYFGKIHERKINELPRNNFLTRIKMLFGIDRAFNVRQKLFNQFFNNPTNAQHCRILLKAILADPGIASREGGNFEFFFADFMNCFSCLYLYPSDKTITAIAINNIGAQFEALIREIEEIPLMHLSARELNRAFFKKTGKSLAAVPETKFLFDFYQIILMKLEVYIGSKFISSHHRYEDIDDLCQLREQLEIQVRRSIRKMLVATRTFH